MKKVSYIFLVLMVTVVLCGCDAKGGLLNTKWTGKPTDYLDYCTVADYKTYFETASIELNLAFGKYAEGTIELKTECTLKSQYKTDATAQAAQKNFENRARTQEAVWAGDGQRFYINGSYAGVYENNNLVFCTSSCDNNFGYGNCICLTKVK